MDEDIDIEPEVETQDGPVLVSQEILLQQLNYDFNTLDVFSDQHAHGVPKVWDEYLTTLDRFADGDAMLWPLVALDTKWKMAGYSWIRSCVATVLSTGYVYTWQGWPEDGPGIGKELPPTLRGYSGPILRELGNKAAELKVPGSCLSVLVSMLNHAGRNGVDIDVVPSAKTLSELKASIGYPGAVPTEDEVAAEKSKIEGDPNGVFTMWGVNELPEVEGSTNRPADGSETVTPQTTGAAPKESEAAPSSKRAPPPATKAPEPSRKPGSGEKLGLETLGARVASVLTENELKLAQTTEFKKELVDQGFDVAKLGGDSTSTTSHEDLTKKLLQAGIISPGQKLPEWDEKWARLGYYLDNPHERLANVVKKSHYKPSVRSTLILAGAFPEFRGMARTQALLSLLAAGSYDLIDDS